MTLWVGTGLAWEATATGPWAAGLQAGWQPGALELFGILWNSADAVTPGLVLS